MRFWMGNFKERLISKESSKQNHLHFLAIMVNRINSTKHNRQQYNANFICAMKEIKLVLLTDECH